MKIECCSLMQDCKVYDLEPPKPLYNNIPIKKDRVYYLKKCKGNNLQCKGRMFVEKIDYYDKVIDTFTVKGDNRLNYIERFSSINEFKESKEKKYFVTNLGRFYLEYSEYGKLKKCFQNFSNLKYFPKSALHDAEELQKLYHARVLS